MGHRDEASVGGWRKNFRRHVRKQSSSMGFAVAFGALRLSARLKRGEGIAKHKTRHRRRRRERWLGHQSPRWALTWAPPEIVAGSILLRNRLRLAAARLRPGRKMGVLFLASDLNSLALLSFFFLLAAHQLNCQFSPRERGSKQWRRVSNYQSVFVRAPNLSVRGVLLQPPSPVSILINSGGS